MSHTLLSSNSTPQQPNNAQFSNKQSYPHQPSTQTWTPVTDHRTTVGNSYFLIHKFQATFFFSFLFVIIILATAVSSDRGSKSLNPQSLFNDFRKGIIKKKD
jgi:hypothetical protein